MINSKKIFQLAQQQGIQSLELFTKRTARLSVISYRNEVENMTSADTTSLYARGLYNGKMGYANTELLDATTGQFVIEQIKENAEITDSEEQQQIFKGSPKYKKVKTYNPLLEQWTAQDKVIFAKQLENKIRYLDSRVDDARVEVEYCVTETMLENSFGLKLKSRRNYFVIYADVVVKDGDVKKNGYSITVDNDMQKLDVDAIAKEGVDNAIAKLGAQPCDSGRYSVIFNPEVTANLVNFFVKNAIAEEVQKHSSVFEGKLNEEVASRCVTVTEMPIRNDYTGAAFDDEGVATYNKPIISKGILKTYAYNLTTSEKDGVQSTGNAQRTGAGKIGTGFNTLCLKPGNIREEHLIGSVARGLYITSVQGLHAGMNPHSGNFSLQAEGFEIEDGVKGRPVALITIAGNLFDMFKDVKAVASNSKLSYLGVECPSIKVGSIAVSGK